MESKNFLDLIIYRRKNDLKIQEFFSLEFIKFFDLKIGPINIQLHW